MEEKFKELVSNYCTLAAEDIKDDMSFREDLGFSSLDLMTFLDEFDIEFELGDDEQKLSNMRTVGDAIEFLKDNIA